MAITANNISIDEIASVLGCNYDLASIRDCDNINPWAKYKPINYNLEAISNPWDKTEDLTGTQRKEVNWGLCAPGYLTFITDITIGTARSFTWTGDYPKWGVHKPNDNVRAVMRLRDFINYEHHNAPDFSISLDQDVYEGSIFKTGLEYIPAQYSTGGRDLNVIDLSDITVSNLGSISDWYVWYIFYQQDSNGKYSSVAACNTGVMVKNCTANTHHPEINDSSKYLKSGQTYTMMACASPTSSGYEVDRVYSISQVSISMVPLTLSSGAALTTFEVSTSVITPPDAEIATTLLTLGNYNSNRTDQGKTDMTFSKSGTTITWTNPYLYYKWSGEGSKANLKLTLATSSGVTKCSTTVRAEFTATYLTSADLSDGSFTFTDCSLNTSDITGIEFRLQYPDGTGEYHLIQTVNAKV